MKAAICVLCGSPKEENHKCTIPDILSCAECKDLGIICTYDSKKSGCHLTHHIPL
jgi:hypothetical protein